jgi:hypothetical protein
MVNCNESECSNRATHNYKNEKDRKYCKNHKKDNMVKLDDKEMYCKDIECIKITFCFCYFTIFYIIYN